MTTYRIEEGRANIVPEDECVHDWQDITSYGIAKPFYKRKCHNCRVIESWSQTIALNPFKGGGKWGEWKRNEK